MPDPFITIGITCFNAEKTIVRCLESALIQDYSSFEVLVVDDYSTDNSPALIKAKIENEKLRLVQHEENLGCAAARNSLIKHAKGEFIVFFDDDDISDRERLMKQVSSIINFEKKQKSKNILSYSSSSKIYENGYRIEKLAVGANGLIPKGHSIFDFIFLGKKGDFYWGDGTPTSTLMARKEVLQELGGFDERLRRVEDLDLALRAGLNNFYFIGTRDVLVERYHSEGPDKRQEINYLCEKLLLLKYKNQLLDMGVYWECKIWFNIRASYFSKKYFQLLISSFIFVLTCPCSAYKKMRTSVPNRLLHEIKMRGK